jgi:geranylgeranyl pyrophosphate synthase
METPSHVAPYLQDVERDMEAELAKEDPRIYGMLVPFLKRGGKRIRPVLAIIACGAVGGRREDVVGPASVIELFHNFTLIHDDIEDDSQFRRGEATLHISFGIPIALNSADALYTLLWKKLTNLKMSPARLVKMQKLCASAFKRVVDGQGLELSWIRENRFDVSEEEYLQMINGKTSALMGLSCEIGAIVGGGKAREQKALREYGESVGAAFQIQDDVLNIIGDFEKYKKEIGGDISEGKRTLMVVHSLRHASGGEKAALTRILSTHSRDKKDVDEAISILKRHGSVDFACERAKALVERAKSRIAFLPDSADKAALIALADYVVRREK